MIRVLIVHDASILSAGLRMMLASAPGIEVAGEADDEAAVEAAVALDPSIILVDADFCRAAGIEVARQLRARCPQAQIVMLGLNDDQETRKEAMLAGACTFVSKQTPGKVLEALGEVGRAR